MLTRFDDLLRERDRHGRVVGIDVFIISLGLAQVAYHLNSLRVEEGGQLPTLEQPCDEPCGPVET